MVNVTLRALIAAVGAVLTMTGCATSGAVTSTPTPIPFPTPTIEQQVVAIARVAPAWIDQCPTATGRQMTDFAITTVPGNVTAPGSCETFVQRGPRSDLVTFKAEWNAGKKYGGKGKYALTYLVPRTNAAAGIGLKLVAQSGEPP